MEEIECIEQSLPSTLLSCPFVFSKSCSGKSSTVMNITTPVSTMENGILDTQEIAPISSLTNEYVSTVRNGEMPYIMTIKSPDDISIQVGLSYKNCKFSGENDVSAFDSICRHELPSQKDVLQISPSCTRLEQHEHGHSIPLWKCPKCEALFKTELQRDKHLSQDHTFTCRLCTAVLVNKDAFQEHFVKTHIKVSPQASDVIINTKQERENELNSSTHESQQLAKDKLEQNSLQSKLQSHQYQQCKSKKFECAHCRKTFTEKGSLKKHMESHNPVNIPCNVCRKICKTQRTLKKHVESHSRIGTTCSVCGKAYRSSVGFASHMASHNPESSKFICEYCEKDCHSHDYLRLHMKWKHNPGQPQTFSCKECGENFKWKQTLKGHMTIKHGFNNDQEVFTCNICKKKFTNKHFLKAHMPKHDSFRPFICEKCGMCFKYQHTKDKHVEVIHSDKREFQCSMCGKLFKTKTYLTIHTNNVHFGGDPVQCTSCDKLFKTPKILQSHREQCHNMEQKKKHICSVCHRGFFSPKDLSRHEKIHTGVKDYSCSQCDKAFSRIDNLHAHMQIHQKVQSVPLIK